VESNKVEVDIKKEYAITLRNAKIVSLIFITLFTPKLVFLFTDLKVFLGLTEVTVLIPMAIGTIIYSIFFYKFWSCPSCIKFPGSGWTRKQCKHCGVDLK